MKIVRLLMVAGIGLAVVALAGGCALLRKGAARIVSPTTVIRLDPPT